MSWSTPKTWNVGDVLTAADMNQYVRDQFAWLGATDGRGTSLPGSPTDGTTYDYVADATNGRIWRVKYNSGESSSSKWEFVGGSPLSVEVLTQQNLTSTGYAAMGTAVSVVTPVAGDFRISHGCFLSTNNVANLEPLATVKLGAAAASDNEAVGADAGSVGGAPIDVSVSRHGMVRTLAASATVAQQYRSPSGTAYFSLRWVEVIPVRIG